MPSYANITTLRLENVSGAVDSYAIFSALNTGARVRLIGIDWTLSSAETAIALYDRLDTMRGIDENGNNTDAPQVSGVIRVDALTWEELTALQSRYSDITVVYKHITYHVYFYSHDGATLLDTQTVTDGGSVTYGGSSPTRSNTAQYEYTFAGWSLTKNGDVNSNALTNVTEDRNVYAAYSSTIRKYTVRFYNGDALLQTVKDVPYGNSATYTGSTPTKESTRQYHYTFLGWSRTNGGTVDADAAKNITGDTNIYAIYENILRVYYEVKFYNGSTLLYTDTVEAGGDAVYAGSTPTKTQDAQYTYTFAGWTLTDGGSTNSSALKNITAARSVYAAYSTTIRKYTVYFYNGSTLLQTVNNVPYGGSATYTGDTPVSTDGTADDGYEFTGFVPTGSNITGTTSCYAQYTSPVTVAEITDDWETIRKNVAAGIHQKTYSVGNYKSLDLGDEGTVTMQIVAMDADETEDGGKVPITWVARELLKTSRVMNSRNSNNAEGTGSIGGWEKTALRRYLNNTIKPLIPEVTCKQIKPVKKESRGYDTSGNTFQNNTADEIWIPSYREIFNSSGFELTGPMYSMIYKDNASRVKMKADETSATIWWLRSASGTDLFNRVSTGGVNGGYYPSSSYGVALGFCTGADTIADSWEEIIASIDDGTYAEKYSVGDTKQIDLGSEGVVCMTLVGIDVDDLADGSGKAKMSWLSEELLATSHRMNPSYSSGVEGTGTIGGWEKSEMRSYMKETLKPLIPEAVRSRIATVTKTQPAYDTTGTSVTQTTQDDVWVPSYDELYGSSGLYHSVFPDNASRIKRKSGSTSAANWWLRSALSTSYFRCVISNGDWDYYYANISDGVALGFCLN